MANNINSVTLTGNLTRDPEVRETPGGLVICKFGLAVNERYKDNASGDWKEYANFFDITVFGAQGKSCGQYLRRGRPVAIQGKLRWRSWEKDGQKRSAVEVIANQVQFLGSREDGGGGSGGSGGSSGGGYRMDGGLSESNSDDGYRMNDADFEPAGAVAAGADDDIPF